MKIINLLLEKLGKQKLIALCCVIAVVIASSVVIPIAVVNSRCEHTYDNACDAVCNECGEERTVTHDFADADCNTPKTCKTCGATEGEPLGHTPARDDGNCTTEQKCTVCGQVAVAAKDAHNDADHDYLCDNAGCQVTVGNPPEDTTPGIDLPIDTN